MNKKLFFLALIFAAASVQPAHSMQQAKEYFWSVVEKFVPTTITCGQTPADAVDLDLIDDEQEEAARRQEYLPRVQDPRETAQREAARKKRIVKHVRQGGTAAALQLSTLGEETFQHG